VAQNYHRHCIHYAVTGVLVRYNATDFEGESIESVDIILCHGSQTAVIP